MGFDVTYHPISPQEMEQWYFAPLEAISKGNWTLCEQAAQKGGLEDFYGEKYSYTLGVALKTSPDTAFDTSHGYTVAVIQGFFRKFYYTRGTAFSFLLEENPYFLRYTQPWEEILSASLDNPIHNRIIQNYCSGVYLPRQQVKQLLLDYQEKPDVRQMIEGFFQENLPVFLRALEAAAEEDLGLLEATDVIEPNPFNLEEECCYCDQRNCDPEGLFNYRKVATAQLEEVARKEGKTLEEILGKVTYQRIHPQGT